MGRLLDQLQRWWVDDRPGVTAWAQALTLGALVLGVALWPMRPVSVDEPMVRARVQRAQASVVLNGAGFALLRLDGAEPLKTTLPVELVFNDGAVVSSGGVPIGMAAELVEMAPIAGSSMRLLDRAWGGRVLVLVREDALDVVVEEPIERYVAGVLSSELFSAWPIECFRAQAIASRSYVAQQMLRANGRVYDVDVDERDQVFLLGAPLEKAVEAARSTRGLILTDEDGQPLRAYFSSACGGRSAWARQIWPARGSLICNDAEPLNGPARAHACHEAPLYRWERRREVEEVSARLRAWGEAVGHAIRRVGRVTAIEVVERAPSGRAGWFEVVDADERRVRVRADDLRVEMNFAGQRPLERGLVLPSNDFEVAINSEVMIVRGRGHGHGVGLCQYCAAGWARQGFKAEQMLSAFYPGAGIERVYE